MLLVCRSSAKADLQMFLTCLPMVACDEVIIPRFACTSCEWNVTVTNWDRSGCRIREYNSV